MKLKTAAADVEIRAEERKLARTHTLADIGKCHQVTQRGDDRSALEPPEIIRVAALACSTDPVSRGRNQATCDGLPAMPPTMLENLGDIPLK